MEIALGPEDSSPGAAASSLQKEKQGQCNIDAGVTMRNCCPQFICTHMDTLR